MDQSPPLTDPPAEGADVEDRPLAFFPASIAGEFDGGPVVVIVRTPREFCHWLSHATSAVQWLQVESLLGEPEVWATAARKESGVALDVLVSDPGANFPHLYRLVDVTHVHEVRVTIPVVPGFTKALRLASSLRLAVRLLPVQPDEDALDELEAAVRFYLHDPMVETPVEFFHSCLASMQGVEVGDLWLILEQDPNEFPRHDETGTVLLPEGVDGALSGNFSEDHLKELVAAGAECAECRWRELCRGYFKHPDPSYSCAGVVKVFDALRQAAEQMDAALAERGAAK